MILINIKVKMITSSIVTPVVRAHVLADVRKSEKFMVLFSFCLKLVIAEKKVPQPKP